MLNALFIIAAMLYVDINMLMSSSRGRMLWTYDECCKHPVLFVPLSNEGKHSEPSVDHNNGVVRCEGLYQASEGSGGPVQFLFLFFYSVRSPRRFQLFDWRDIFGCHQTLNPILIKVINYKSKDFMKQSDH